MRRCCWTGGALWGCGNMKMAKANFWKRDWLVGLIVSIGVLFFGDSDLLQSLERKAYAWPWR